MSLLPTLRPVISLCCYFGLNCASGPNNPRVSDGIKMFYDFGRITHHYTIWRYAMGNYTISSNDGVPANNKVTAIADNG